MWDKTLAPPLPPNEVQSCASLRLQVSPCLSGCRRVFGHQLGDLSDEVGLLSAAFAGLIPLLQDLLQVLHLQLLQVHRGQVQLFVCRGVKGLSLVYIGSADTFMSYFHINIFILHSYIYITVLIIFYCTTSPWYINICILLLFHFLIFNTFWSFKYMFWTHGRHMTPRASHDL